MNNLSHRLGRRSSPGKRGFRIAATAVVCSTALLLASCVEDDADTDGPEVEQAVGLAVDAPRITLHDPGTGDLRMLTYTDAVDSDTDAVSTPQTLTLSVGDGLTQYVVPADEVDPTAPAGGDLSTMRLPLTANTGNAEPMDGEVLASTRDITIQVGQPAFTDLELTEDIRSGEGFTLGIRADDRGQQSTISFAAPVDATDTGRLVVEQYLLKYTSLPVLFPDEEVGVGASWSVDSRVSGEATLLQTVTYTVTGIRGDTVDLDVSISQRPSLGAIDISTDTTGVTEDTPDQLTVLNSNTTSTGAISVDLSQPIPVSGTVSWTTRVVYGGGTDDIRVVQDSASSISFES